MGWMDGVKKGMRKAADEAADLAKVARIKSELSKLNRDRRELYEAMGRELFEMHQRGESVMGFGTKCQSVEALNEAIAAKESEIESIRADEEPGV